MKKSLKTMVTVAIIILIVLQLPITVSAALKVPSATSDFYVNDFSGVFTPDEVNRLMVLVLVLCISFAVLFICSVIYIIIKLKRNKQTLLHMEEEHDSEIENLSQKYENIIRDWSNNFQSENNRAELLHQKNNELELELSDLQDRYRRVKRLYPNADKEVSDMIQEEIRQENIKKAKVVEEAIKSVLVLEPCIDGIATFTRVINDYSRLTEEQKNYVEANVEEVRELLSKSEKLKLEYEEKQYRVDASTAMKIVEGKIRGISKGNANNLNQLEDALEVYSRLRVGAKKYFDESLLKKVKRLFNEAKADKERLEREEEERRRRQRMQSTINNHSSYSGHSSFRSSSSFGGHSGFGGRSGGGGASRSF